MSAFLLIMVGVAASPLPVQAQVLSYTSLPLDMGGSAPSTSYLWSGAFTLPGFDPALGELQGVWLEFQWNATAVGDMNPPSPCNDVTPVTLVLRANDSLTLGVPSGTPSFTVQSNSGNVSTYLDSCDNTYFLSTGAFARGILDADNSALAEFIGTGTLALPVTYRNLVREIGSSGATWNPAYIDASASATITYFYQSVPESGTLALAFVVSSSGSLLLFRRRRR